MSYQLRKAVIAVLFISFTALQGQTDSKSPVEPEEHIAVHCDFDQGTATTSIPFSEIENLKKILLIRFGLPQEKDFPLCKKDFKIKREIRVNASTCSYAAYLMQLHHKKNYRC